MKGELLQSYFEREEVDFSTQVEGIALACSSTVTGKTVVLGTDAGRWANVLVET